MRASVEPATPSALTGCNHTCQEKPYVCSPSRWSSTAGALNASPALASGTQQSIIQDDSQLKADPVGTMQIFRNLGVDKIRVNLTWDTIATNKKPANGANPASYPAANWAPYDNIVRYAQADGIQVYFTLTGPAPRWALGPASGERHRRMVGAFGHGLRPVRQGRRHALQRLLQAAGRLDRAAAGE